MQKFKACLTKGLTGDQPTDAEVAEAVNEVLDTIATIANSLERIAIAQEHIAAGA